MNVSPQVPAEGIRDLEHACEVATWLVGCAWGRQNLSEGQREAVAMLISEVRQENALTDTKAVRS